MPKYIGEHNTMEDETQVRLMNDCYDSYRGEVFSTLRALTTGDVIVGYIDYSVVRKEEVAIKMVEVAENSRHQGIATALMNELHKLYPGLPIYRGGSTPDGTAFLKAYDKHQSRPQ
jgi:ribosomal protein S18 acetylase RimI-like enzyme